VSGATILVIDDEPQVRRFLRATLQSHGFTVLEAASGQDGLREVAQRHPDVVLLDLGLPDLDGLAVTQRLREWTAVPILVLSARGQERDKVQALEHGADDYLTKPFGTDELVARIKVAQPVFICGELRVDLARREVAVAGVAKKLTPIEYKLLTLLVRHAGRVVMQNQLLTEVWGAQARDQTHYLRVHMSNLRRKLERDPAQPVYVLTEPGVGYRLRDGD
jgi:two-component system KDP operon response regulator KdpE